MKTPDYLKACRARLGVASNYALAAKWGITQGALSQLEKGLIQPGLKTRILIAKTLELPLEEVATDPDLERPGRIGKQQNGGASLHCLLVTIVAGLLSLTVAASTNAIKPERSPSSEQVTNYAAFVDRLIRLVRSMADRVRSRVPRLLMTPAIDPLQHAVMVC